MSDPTTPSAFEGHYIFTRDDYLALVQATMPQQRGARTILVIVWISFFVLVMGLMSEDWPQFVQAMRDLVTFNDVPFFVYIPLLGGLGAIILLPSVALMRAMRLYSSLATADQLIGIALDETSIVTTAPGRQFRLDWPTVKRVVVRPDHLFLTISRHEGLVVPKRAFASTAEFAAVTALAQRKLSAAKPG